MAEPTPYEREYDFTGSDKGVLLNEELANIEAALASTRAALAEIRRSDGALQNNLVTPDSLNPAAVSVLGPNGDLTAEAVAAAAGSATAAAASASAANGSANASAASAAGSAASALAASGSATTAAASAASATASAAAAGAAKVAFMAHRNGTDQTGIVTATATKVVANSEVFDQGAFYDNATARWTPSAGRYRLSAAALVSANVVDGSQYRAMIYKNGSLFRQGIAVAAGTAALTVAVSAIDVASGTDYYEFFVQGDGTGDKTVSGAAANTWFEGSAL